MRCPGPDRIAALASLPPDEQEALHRHLATCANCQVQAQQLVRSQILSGERTPLTVDEGNAPAQRARSDMEALDPLKRGESVGRYVVIDLLGRGGMGVVYAAYDPELDRKVALKLLQAQVDPLHATQASLSGQTRLLREAQSLAKLAHPNVVSVFDAGTFGDRVFVAMELVDGDTLRAWQKTPRQQREVTAVYRAAAEGLAAAHRAGIVHRDVKPDNILLGRDGRVRVMDFGLARPSRTASSEPAADAGESALATPIKTPPAMSTPGSHASDITQDGTVVGTPSYMAPEQLDGRGADARTDQFSFCVALFEALTGARPFNAAAKEPSARWRLPESTPRHLPSRLRKILHRGLALDPAQRFESMEALSAALAREPLSPRSWALGTAAVAGLAAVTWFNFAGGGEAVCSGAAEQLGGVWDPTVAAAVQKGFEATGRPDAPEVFSRVRPVIDRYADDWAQMHREACMATRVRQEQSDELLELRMICLENRRQELRALGAYFAHADAAALDRAVQTAYSLSELERCADLEELRAPAPLPKDPAARAKIAAAQAKLAEGRVLLAAGQYKPALEAAQAASVAAADVDHSPLRAAQRLLEGTVQYWRADYPATETLITDALVEADRAHEDRIRLKAALVFAHVHHKRAQLDQATFWTKLAQGSLSRLGADPLTESEVLRAAGLIATEAGHYEQAIRDLERSLALTIQALGEEHPTVASALNNLATAYDAAGQLDKAVEVHLRALPMREKLLGPKHPMIGQTLNNLSSVMLAVGRTAEALPHAQRAKQVLEGTLNATHPRLGIALAHLGRALAASGRHEEALPELDRALAIFEGAFGADHPNVASVHEYRAIALRGLNRTSEAIAALERAVRIEEKFKPEGRPELATQLEQLSTLVAPTDAKRASALHKRAVEIAVRTLPVTSQDRQRITGEKPQSAAAQRP